MDNLKLIQVLSTLSNDEWSLLEMKLLTVNASRSAKVAALLKPYFIDKSPNDLPDKTTFFKALYPGRRFDDHLIREEFSLLYGHVKGLLADLEQNQDALTRRIATLKQLRKRQTLKAYEAELKRVRTELNSTKLGDETDNWNAMLLADERDQYFGLQQVRRYDENLQVKLDELDRYYVIRKLKESCEMLNRKNIISSEYEVRLLDEVLLWVEREEQHLLLPIVKVYYLIIQTLLGKADEQHFEELVELLSTSWSTFPKAEARNMYRYAQNYCIRRINKGDRPYFGKLFNIYEELLRTELILDGGQMDRTDYKNIATVAMRFGKQEWTMSFLERYRDSLPDQYRDMAYELNMANYLYDIGAYDKALDMLQQAKFNDIFYDMSARHLLLKIFYETDEMEAFAFQLESFKVFLKRSDKISPHNKNSNLNFLKVCRRLASLKQAQGYIAGAKKAERLGKLNEMIGRYDPLANKPWLMQKLAQLQG